MSIVMNILESLITKEHTYKGARYDAFGIPLLNGKKDRSVALMVLRLLRKKYIKNEDGSYAITKTGKKYFNERSKVLKSFKKPNNHAKEKDLIVLFDIPSDRKHTREWLRLHLKRFDFVMIQKSVWVGPSPLPKEFKDYLKNIKLEKCLKVLRLGKPYTDKMGNI